MKGMMSAEEGGKKSMKIEEREKKRMRVKKNVDEREIKELSAEGRK